MHHVQRLFPDRRGAGVGNGAGHGVDQAEGRGRGRQRLAVFVQITAVQQALNDPGAGGFGANAGGVLEFLFEQRVLDPFGDVFHGLDQVALGERLGRLGPQVFKQDVRHRTLEAFVQARQRLRCRGFTALGRGQGFGQGAFPAWLDDLLAHRAQGLPRTVEIGLGAVVFMVGQELRQVTRANQGIDGPLLAAQAFEVFRGRRGDDAVVGADLGVIPRP